MLSIGRDFGSILHLQVGGTALYAAGLFAGEDELRITGRMLTEGLLLAGVTRIVLGVATGRTRPYLNRDPWTFSPPGWKDERQSFPSGHAAFACVASTVLADRISHPIATGVLFALAALTGVSRISDDQHWFSDVVAGSALGIAAGAYVVSRERSRRHGGSGETTGIRILPGPDRIVLVVSL
jgi:membrane-associated phospholipid phosphatase